MITSQASKLPSNLGIRGVCILSLRLVYNFPFQLPGRCNQWPGWAVTRLPPPLSPSLGIVINPRWLLSPSLQMLSDHRLAITTLNDWNTRIIGGVTASQCYGNIEISRWGQWSPDWQLWVGCVDWWHVQCSVFRARDQYRLWSVTSHILITDYGFLHQRLMSLFMCQTRLINCFIKNK